MPNSHPRLTVEDHNQAIIDAARCKASRRHRLDPISPPVGAPRPQFGSFIFERCETCGSIRLAHVSRITGELLGPYRYDHPSWYDDALSEKQSPAWWRATYLETLSPELFVEPDEVATRRKRRKAS